MTHPTQNSAPENVPNEQVDLHADASELKAAEGKSSAQANLAPQVNSQPQASAANQLSHDQVYQHAYNEGFKQANLQWLNTQLFALTQEVNSLKASNSELKRELEFVRESLTQLQQHRLQATSTTPTPNTIKKVVPAKPNQAGDLPTNSTQGPTAVVRKSASPEVTKVDSTTPQPDAVDAKKEAAELARLNQERQFRGLPPLTKLPADYYQRGKNKTAAKPTASATKAPAYSSGAKTTASTANTGAHSSVASALSGSPAWFATAKYLQPEDFIELQNVELDAEDARVFPSVLADLKSPTTAMLLHFFLGTFGVGYYYVGRPRWKIHLTITIVFAICFLFLVSQLTAAATHNYYSRDIEQLLATYGGVQVMFWIWGLYLFVMLFFIGKDARKANSFILRDWLIARGYPVDPKNNERF